MRQLEGGGVLFTALALLYLVLFWGRFHWSAYAMISGPLCLVGVLFLLNWLWRADLSASPEPGPPAAHKAA